MASRFEVKDFGQKLKLVLRSGKSTRFKRVTDVAKVLVGVSPDYLSRLVNGTRSLTESGLKAPMAARHRPSLKGMPASAS